MTVLADTSVWIDHFRRGDPILGKLLTEGHVVMHPFVIGELALGRMSDISGVIDSLRELPSVVVAGADEVLRFILDRDLSGLGIGYVDAHLLAAALLTPEARLWTRDRRLNAAAHQLSLAVDFER